MLLGHLQQPGGRRPRVVGDVRGRDLVAQALAGLGERVAGDPGQLVAVLRVDARGAGWPGRGHDGADDERGAGRAGEQRGELQDGSLRAVRGDADDEGHDAAPPRASAEWRRP